MFNYLLTICINAGTKAITVTFKVYLSIAKFECFVLDSTQGVDFNRFLKDKENNVDLLSLPYLNSYQLFGAYRNFKFGRDRSFGDSSGSRIGFHRGRHRAFHIFLARAWNICRNYKNIIPNLKHVCANAIKESLPWSLWLMKVKADSLSPIISIFVASLETVPSMLMVVGPKKSKNALQK